MIERLRQNTLGQVREVVRSCDQVLTLAELSEIEHFCYHNEYAEAVLTLANIIVEKKAMVPRRTIVGMREFLEGFAEAEFLPENLDDFAVDQT
jgi:predicted translin family RNA/ssDNA-binding protein